MVADTPTDLQFITPANCPEFRKLVAPLAEASWPEFMLHDVVADEHWGALFERFPDYQFGYLDPSSGAAVAMGNSVPLRWSAGFDELPDDGWDWALAEAVQTHRAGLAPNVQCAIQINIRPDYRGKGLSPRMVEIMRSIGRSKGFRSLIAPVRPSQKSQYPLANIDRYIQWMTPDGLPFDAWLRVHARLGATIIKACHRAMTIRGTVAEWQSWTGLHFPESGSYVIPGALNPVEFDLEADQGLYIEPNVWMVHGLE